MPPLEQGLPTQASAEAHVVPPNPIGHWHVKSVELIVDLTADMTDDEGDVAVTALFNQQLRCPALYAHATQSVRSMHRAAQWRASEPAEKASE